MYRIWIQAEPVNVLTRTEDGRVSYIFDDATMLIKTQKQKYNMKLKRIDERSCEPDGWPCYVLNPKAYQLLTSGDQSLLDKSDKKAFVVATTCLERLMNSF